ncbi:AbiH family protein [Acinetobacter baumannii]
MQFDDLFGSLYEKENYFFKYTKAMYQTDEIKISTEQVKELKQKLKENVWYQYFSDHVREIKTWIDFEQKIEEALIYTTHFLDKINEVSLNENKLERVIRTSGYKASDYDNKFIYLGEKMCHVLCSIGLLNKDYYNVGYDDNGRFRKEIATEETNSHEYVISSKFIRSFSNYDIYNNEGGLNFLNNQLDSFILIFNLYLELFIKTLTPIVDLIEDFNFGFVDKIFSFNYTNTYIKFYDASVDTDFLHGSCGENQNIVLGISELKGDLLRNLKAYGFTKYHQKLFKNTDYQFLSEDRNIQKILNFWKVIKERNLAITLAEKEKHIINIFIWGHSLDISDEIYINEVFSLNDGKYFNTNVIIYYFDNHAKFNLLTNLLHILGKEKVELWMKKGWLKFEPNPNIVELNNIEPVDLTKLK